MRRYLLIPRISIQNANAHSAAWIVNAAPVMAINMFCHNLGRSIGAIPDAVAIIHHDHQMCGEWAKGRFLLHQRRNAMLIDKGDNASTAKGPAPSLQPTASTHLTASLVLQFSQGFSNRDVLRFLRSARIAGGQVVSFQEKGMMVYESKDDLLKALPKTGFWIIERTDLLEDSDKPLDDLIEHLIAMEVKGEDVETEAEDTRKKPKLTRKHPWLVPTVLGYAMITDFAERENARAGSDGQEYPHAFAEPLVGPVQYVSMRHHKGDLPFWEYKWLNDKCFVVTQTKGEKEL